MTPSRCPIDFLQSLVADSLLPQDLVNDWLQNSYTPRQFKKKHSLENYQLSAFKYADKLHRRFM